MAGRAAVLPVERSTQAEKARATAYNNDKRLEENPGISLKSVLQPYSCADLRGCEAGRNTRAEGQCHLLAFGCSVLMAGGDTNPGLPGRFQKHIWDTLWVTQQAWPTPG